jgi:hypothetical protein
MIGKVELRVDRRPHCLLQRVGRNETAPGLQLHGRSLLRSAGTRAVVAVAVARQRLSIVRRI